MKRCTSEHLTSRSLGSSDRSANLGWAWRAGNQRGATGHWRRSADGSGPLRAAEIRRRVPASRHAVTAGNATRKTFTDAVNKTGLPVQWGRSGRAAGNRQQDGYPKQHWIDAAGVGQSGLGGALGPELWPWLSKATGRGYRQRCTTDKYGFLRRHRGRAQRDLGYETRGLVQAVIPTGQSVGTHVG